MQKENMKRTYQPTPPQFDWLDIAAKAAAERHLLGAMLREPYNLHLHLVRLNPVCLANASNDLAPVFAEIMKQHGEMGNYSPITITAKTGVNLATIAADSPEVDLAWAIDNWEHEYRIWAENAAYDAGRGQRHISPDAMRVAVEETRENLGANGTAARVSGVDEFLRWGSDKIDGKVVTWPTANVLTELKPLIPAFEPGYMWVIAGRPGMGKTQFALNLLSTFADNKAHGLFFSIEMTAPDIYKRMLGIRHGINARGNWMAQDASILKNGLLEVAGLPINVIDSVTQMAEIEAICVTENHKRKLDFVFVDYIGLVVPSRRQQSREREVASISEGLTRLAKRLKIAVIAMAQLSRANETRGGSKRPMLSDLRDSGGIEQDAASVLFLHRPEYYGIMEDENGQTTAGKAELIVAKNRNGEVGIATCDYKVGKGFLNGNPFSAYQQTPNHTIEPSRQEPDEMPF